MPLHAEGYRASAFDREFGNHEAKLEAHSTSVVLPTRLTLQPKESESTVELDTSNCVEARIRIDIPAGTAGSLMPWDLPPAGLQELPILWQVESESSSTWKLLKFKRYQSFSHDANFGCSVMQLTR